MRHLRHPEIVTICGGIIPKSINLNTKTPVATIAKGTAAGLVAGAVICPPLGLLAMAYTAAIGASTGFVYSSAKVAKDQRAK